MIYRTGIKGEREGLGFLKKKLTLEKRKFILKKMSSQEKEDYLIKCFIG